MSKFDVQPVAAPKRGRFRLGNMHTTTLDFGRLQVAKIMECVPNDVVNLDMSAYCQAAPNPSPINGKMSLSLHAFFVPTRVICSEWNNYILGLSNPVLPYMTVQQIQTSVASPSHDYNDSFRHMTAFGLPTAYIQGGSLGMTSYRVSALPFRAFNRVWWDWYRDKQRISDANISTYVFDSMGAVTTSEALLLCSPKYRCFNKDYITTAYDEPSEGGRVAISPIQTSDNSNLQRIFNSENNSGARSLSNSSQISERGAYVVDSVNNSGTVYSNGSGSSASAVFNSVRNVGSASSNTNPRNVSTGQAGISVQELRGAAAYQRYLERLNVAGKSIISRLKALFNADDTPERLDMSEYLGGTSQDFTFTTTTATSSGSNQTVDIDNFNAYGPFGFENKFGSMLGQKVANGVCDLTFGNITYHAKEHGYLLIVSSILPVVANYQGIDRMFLRGVATGTSSRFDFFTPDMENIGFQPVLMSEVVTPSALSGTIPATFDGLSIFGWQQRYMDYKYSHDQISSDFCLPSTSVGMQSFHLGRNILRELGFVDQAGAAITGSAAPSDFVTVVTPSTLVQCDHSARAAYDDKFTVSSDELDHFIINFKFDITAVRPMTENVLPSIDNADNVDKMVIPTGGVRL